MVKRKRSNINGNSFASRAFDILNILLMLIIVFVTLYPIIYLIAISLSQKVYVMANKVSIYPIGFNLDSYRQIFQNIFFWNSYKNTIVYTVIGTAINLVFTCSLAFCLSKRYLIFRKTITFFIVFTMFFGGGIIPNFILIKQLGIYNTIWALVVPGAISTYNMIIVRTYFMGLPEEIFESARIDGANDLYSFINIAIPLSLPVIATIALFYAVGHWNEFFSALIYLKDKEKAPVQLLLQQMIMQADTTGIPEEAGLAAQATKPTVDMVTAASMITAMIPILCVYPFIQKYFVKGVMIGSLKG